MGLMREDAYYVSPTKLKSLEYQRKIFQVFYEMEMTFCFMSLDFSDTEHPLSLFSSVQISFLALSMCFEHSGSAVTSISYFVCQGGNKCLYHTPLPKLWTFCSEGQASIMISIWEGA